MAHTTPQVLAAVVAKLSNRDACTFATTGHAVLSQLPCPPLLVSYVCHKPRFDPWWLTLRKKRITRIWLQLRGAVASGQLSVVQWLQDAYGGFSADDVLISRSVQLACSRGHLNIAQWLATTFELTHNHFSPTLAQLLTIWQRKMGYNHRVYQFCGSEYPELSSSETLQHLFDHVCSSGFLDVAQWLFSYFSQEDCFRFKCAKALERACEFNQTHIVQWLLVEFSGLKTSKTTYGWPVRGTFGIYIDENEVNRGLLKASSVAVVQMLKNYADSTHSRVIDPADCFVVACTSGHLEVAQYFFDPQLPCSVFVEAFLCACTHAHLSVAQWLFDVCPRLDDTNVVHLFATVCYRGHLRLLQWLHSTSQFHIAASYLKTCFQWACYGGHWALVQWLRSLSECAHIMAGSCYSLRTPGHFKIAQWFFLQSKRPVPAWWFEAACWYGNVEAARYVASVCIISAEMLTIALHHAVVRNHVATVRWLLATFDISTSCLIPHCRNFYYLGWEKSNNLETLHCLVQHYGLPAEQPGIWECDFWYVCNKGHVDIVKWMFKTFRVFSLSTVEMNISDDFCALEENKLATICWIERHFSPLPCRWLP